MRFAWTCLIALLVGAGASGGCIIAGYAAHVYGDPPVPARFVLGPHLTAIVVRDQPDPTGQTVEGEVLASEIEQNIKAKNAGIIVPSVKTSDLRSSDPNKFETMTPQQIGHAVGAEQIIYVEVERSSVSAGEGNDMLKGQIAATVAVYEMHGGTMLWPTDGSSGDSVTYATPTLRANGDVNSFNMRRNIYAGLADKVAKLFYTYKPDEE
jgi:hypothetical protein